MRSDPTGRIIIGVKAGEHCGLAAYGSCTHQSPDLSRDAHVHTLVHTVSIHRRTMAFILPDAPGGVGSTQAWFNMLHRLATSQSGPDALGMAARSVLSNTGFPLPQELLPGAERRFAAAYAAFADADGCHFWGMGSEGPEEVEAILEAPEKLRPLILEAIAASGKPGTVDSLGNLLYEVMDKVSDPWVGDAKDRDKYKWLQVVTLSPSGD